MKKLTTALVIMFPFFLYSQEVRVITGTPDHFSVLVWKVEKSKPSRVLFSIGTAPERTFVEYYFSPFGKKYDYTVAWSESESICCTAVTHQPYDWMPTRKQVQEILQPWE